METAASRRPVSRKWRRTVLNLMGMLCSEVELPIEASVKLGCATGVMILGVQPDSVAYAAGIRCGDIVAELNSEVIRKLEQLETFLTCHDPNEPVYLLLCTGYGWQFRAIGGRNGGGSLAMVGGR